MIVRPVPYQLVVPTPCFDCRVFPCVCERESPPRVERCLCGGAISAGGSPMAIAAAVASHQTSTAHQQWRLEHGL